jgi:hypothetical protein
MASEEQFNERESLKLIQQMIGVAKQEQKDDGKGWILWGWLLFAASVFSFLNMKLGWLYSLYFFWNAFGIITICFSIYNICKYFFSRTKKKVRTYAGDLLQKLNIGFIISMMFIIVAINISILKPETGFIFLINLYGFRILIQGAALNFRPFMVGAFISWGLGFIGLFIRTFDGIMLIHAAAVLSGFIIPGHIANNEFRKTKPMIFNTDEYSV